ncbi:MAG: hypothetical protein V3S01_12280 [Dehalococcoidia bacterium]
MGEILQGEKVVDMDGEQGMRLGSWNETNSSMFEKVPKEVRVEINRGLIDREPATFRGVFARVKGGGYGVSYSAFYRYARRVRGQAAMFEMAEATASAGKEVPAMLPKVLAQRLLETLAFEEVSPRHIQRMTDAYKTAVKTQVTIRQHGLFRPPADAEVSEDLVELFKQYRELVERQEAVSSSE